MTGLDVARCVAIFWMFVAHIGPDRDAGGVNRLLWLGDGREAALFALLAGVSLTLVHRSRPPAPWREREGGDGFGRFVRKTLIRAAVVLLLGLALAGMETGVLVILPFFALYFVLALPALYLSTNSLFVVAAWWAVLGPLVSFGLRSSWHQTQPGYRVPDLEAFGDPGEMATTLFVTGTYPVLTWMPFVLAGMAVGRLDLLDRTVQRLLVEFGTVAAVVGYGSSWLLINVFGGRDALSAAAADWFATPPTDKDPVLVMLAWFTGTVPADDVVWLTVAQGHSGTPFEIVGATGVGCAVLGICLRVGASARAGTWLAVPAAVGAMSLSVYTVHLIAGWSPLTPGAGSWVRLGAYTAAAGGGAWLWSRFAGKGPLESVIAFAADGWRRGSTGRPGRAGAAGPRTE
ncbi:heparan-alpha-glucosaminide N-acetyltransferase domain-containing protein [Yinghuangia sp. YIM S10712]|uniref:heparan-alpha-glucosaminide N-acetyltransferase domain-containing protein n=1 Tax=Yinghuangia sp. YIM S10712 TaxID=3436930 RepID=UPI003F539839